MEETQIDTSAVIAMTPEDLLEAVKNQVEYYFSKENLQSDAFLTSQMDAQMTVPIAVVMKFAKLKALTQDEVILRKALESSTITQVVDDRIKANIKPVGRNTIILREIPTDTPEAEVREIFNYEGCKPISSIRSDIGDTWFVQMDSEEDAKDTLLDLRLKKRTFNGQSLKARLKTETVIRSFYPLQATPVIPVGFTPMGFSAQALDMRQFGYALPEGVMPLPVMMGKVGAVDASGAAVDPSKTESEHGQGNTKSGAGNREGRKNNQQQAGTGRGSNSRKTEGNNTGRSKGGNNNAAGHTKAPVIEINSSNFPPLNSEDTPVPTPGYKGDFQKYGFDEIIAIVKEVKEATLPAALNPVNHPLAMTATVNMDLLKKQRTYSIDETREQLRQGRPVHREAITAGAVDYRSLMYGDESQQQQQPVPAVPTNAQPAVVAPPAATPKSATKARSNSQSSVGEGAHQGQTPKKISASSWAAMVKTSAAATAATESTTPARSVRQQAAKTATPAVDAKKSGSAATPAKGGERKRSSSKGGDAKDGKSADARKEGRDRKKSGAAPAASKETGIKKENSATSTSETACAPSTTDSVPAQQAEGSAAPTSATWGGKTSFAQIVKLATPEDGEGSPASAASPVKTAEAAKRPATAGGRHGTVTKSVSGSRTAGSGSRPTGSNGGERKPRPVGEKKERSTTSSGGADAGVWVREALPALAKK